VQVLSKRNQYETIWLDGDGQPLPAAEQEWMRRENAREAGRRARENSVFNARIALIHEFERQQLEKREWISFAEIIDWRSRDRIDGSINEHKYQQTLDDLRREIAAGTFFFERGHPRILFISPQYRVRRGILADLSAANEGNWVSRQRWLAWAESHSPAILTDAVLMWCWIPRDICLTWCANLPFQPKPEWNQSWKPSGGGHFKESDSVKAPAKRGPPYKYDWPLIEKYVVEAMDHNGCFSMDDPDWSKLPQLMNVILEKLGMEEPTSQLRKNVGEFCEAWRKKKSTTEN
jgi:hypothetical protein